MENGYVYLINIKDTDKYKIGITKNLPKDRLKELQTGNPIDLEVIDFYQSYLYRKIETVIHRLFKHKKYIIEDFKNLKGEWFLLKNEDVASFTNSCKKIEDNLKFLKNNSVFYETFF